MPPEHSNHHSSIYPVVYGHEQEMGLRITQGNSDYDRTFSLSNSLHKYVPESVLPITERGFLANGSRLYIDGQDEKQGLANIEFSTPECTSINELIGYIHAGRRILGDIALCFAKRTTQPNECTRITIQDRVVDRNESRKGCHDNFGLTSSSVKKLDLLKPSSLSISLLIAHLSTRHFISGAGYVHKNGLRYSQKIDGLINLKARGYYGTMYTTRPDGDTYRLETRCNDANISDWATFIRIGTTALTLAVAHLPAAKELFEKDLSFFKGNERIIDEARNNNHADVQPDGALAPSEEQYRCLDFHKKLAEAALKHLPRFGYPLPPELQWAAEELQRYCEDYQRVLDGESDINILADRSDWAAKFMCLVENTKSSQAKGKQRTLYDETSQRLDMFYDATWIAVRNGEQPEHTRGFGHKLREEKKIFAFTIPNERIANAYHNAPESTRAAIRAELISRHPISKCGWAEVLVGTDNNKVRIDLRNPLKTELTEEEKSSLDESKR